MKIGILTLPLHNNYGGNLQAYALLTYLKKQGHQPILINLVKPQGQYTSKRAIKAVINALPFIGNIYRGAKDVGIHSNYFINTYIQPQTLKIEGRDDFAKLEKYGFDAYIVGSDQVWRKDYAEMYIKDYFFDFVKTDNIKRISYAASFGVDSWQFDEKLTIELRELAQKFDLVCVREDSAVELCERHLNVHAEHVIDPTMLLNKEEYIELIKKEKAPQSQGDCMVYVLDNSEDKKDLINRICKDAKLTWYTVNALSKSHSDSIDARRFPPVANWLKGFLDAKFVITDSFHGMAFSIIFNKPFIVVGNRERGFARFTSIAGLFDVHERLLSSVDDYDPILLNQQINWDEINKRLDDYREKSNQLLGTHLK